ncbi:DNA helicase [Mycetocola tolaasinivorans]|uniref:DNA helicase n=1 Tax=Mycetocola tolaasinivorans TaxID=76635 RepID=A0A3L7A4S8_9MICO|nr:DNA helicase [Mycetocola tolaasinivorans]RLP75217.1 DNA helicase [Mycetocola tolaasinivorans]
MNLSRQRKKEIKRLKGDASALWAAQQELLEHANSVAREAGRQVGNYSREQVVPGVVQSYEQHVQPVLNRGAAIGRDVVDNAKHTVDHRVVPAIGAAVGTVLSIGDVARDKRVQSALARVDPKAAFKRAAAVAAPVKQKKKRGVGSVLAIGAGVLAAAGVAYALWQTFRADDELWVSEDEPTSNEG